MRLERRAWVGPVRMRDVVFQVGKQFSLVVEIKNSGATPARIMSSRVRSLPLPPRVKFAAQYEAADAPPSTAVIQPGMVVDVPLKGSQAVSQPLLDGIKSGALTLYIFGEVLYRDIFDQQHFTRFCSFLEPDMSSIKWCETYNEAD